MIAADICKDDVGEPKIAISLDPATPPAAHQPVTFDVTTLAAGDPGVVGPFEVTLSSGFSQPSFQRRVYREHLPSSLTFYPREGGPHVLRVREIYHQQYVGTLRFDVAGDRLEASTL